MSQQELPFRRDDKYKFGMWYSDRPDTNTAWYMYDSVKSDQEVEIVGKFRSFLKTYDPECPFSVDTEGNLRR